MFFQHDIETLFLDGGDCELAESRPLQDLERTLFDITSRPGNRRAFATVRKPFPASLYRDGGLSLMEMLMPWLVLGAKEDFEIVAANLLDNDPRRVTDRIQTYALFTDPPLGRAGMSEAEVLKSGKKALLGKRPMTKITRARIKGETDGFMKILIDAETKLILGAAILGPEADEIIHSILDVMYAKAPYTVIQRAMHIHPTVTELIPTMLTELKPLK